MARIFTESFEGNHLLQWGSGNDYRTTSFLSLDGSTYCGTCIGGARFGDFSVTASSELYIGMYYYAALSNAFPMQWYGGGGQLGYLIVDNASKELKGFDGTTTWATGKILTANTAYHIQVRIKIDNAVGILQIKVDEVLVLNKTGIDSQPGAVSTIDQFRIGQDSGFSYQDSIVVNDTTGAADTSWPGIVRFKAKLVAGAGFHVNQWSRNTGATNFSAVQDIPPDNDTTYLFTSAPAISESFSMTNPVIPFANFRALRTTAVVKKDSGTVKLALGVRDLENSTDYTGTAQNLATSYAFLEDRRLVDPSTSLSWTQAGLAAVEALILSST